MHPSADTGPRIGVLIDRLNVGGVEKIAIQQVRALRRLGIDAQLLVLSSKALAPGAFPELLQGLPVVQLDRRLPRIFRMSFRFPFFNFFSLFHLTYPFLLPWAVTTREWDFIVSHNSYTTFTALALSRFRGIPYVMYVWDPIVYVLERAYPRGPVARVRRPSLPAARALDRRLANKARTVLVAGDLHASYLLKIVADQSKVVILPPGHDAIDKPPARRNDFLLAVTQWREGKELETLLTVLADIPGVHVKVAGRWTDDNYRVRITKLVHRLGLANRVAILGEVSEDALRELYRTARATVFVSEERGFGLPALEAAANGCPFVVPRGSGVTRYFEDGEGGFFFDHGDMFGLKYCLTRLCTDERLAYFIGLKGWERARTGHSWQEHARILLDVTRPEGRR